MRALLVALVSVLSWSAAPPASAQWPPGPYTFVQGQTYSLFYTQPSLENFLGADIFIRYPVGVFDPIALLPGTPVGLTSMLDVIAGSPTNVSPGIDEVHILIMPSNNPLPGPLGINLPEGSLFGVQFQVKLNAPKVPTNVATDVEFALGNPADVFGDGIVVKASVPITTNIVAIPEPESWALMLAGLALVGGAALRARRQA